MSNLKRLTQRYLPERQLDRLGLWYVARHGRRTGVSVRREAGVALSLVSDDRAIRIAQRHYRYALEIMGNFDFYFDAVEPERRGGLRVVDFASPRDHRVHGYPLHPVAFAAIAEPAALIAQYAELLALAPGQTVLDLGSYSGLTAIMFKQVVGGAGQVVAVEADPGNFGTVQRNLDRFRATSGLEVASLNAAIWRDDGGVTFSVEGNQGSSALSIVGGKRGAVAHVPSFTLSGLQARLGLARVDAIKCDIEGAEAVIFGDEAFFAGSRPRILIETHDFGRGSTARDCIAALRPRGYSTVEIAQKGSTNPLLLCTPD